MRKVILLFPDLASIAEFLLTHKVSKSQVDSTQKTLSGIMAEKDVVIACEQYGARVKSVIVIGLEK
jgi:hypothetical protein